MFLLLPITDFVLAYLQTACLFDLTRIIGMQIYNSSIWFIDFCSFSKKKDEQAQLVQVKVACNGPTTLISDHFFKFETISLIFAIDFHISKIDVIVSCAME